MINSQLNSDEREQHLRQIRELLALNLPVLDRLNPEYAEAIRHINFLLSLYDSQAAELELLRKATANPEDANYGATVYNGEGNYTLLAENAINRNVTAIRDKCVEKVDAIFQEVWVEFAAELKPDGASFSILKREAILKFLRRLKPAIQSLTLDQEEQKHQ